MLAGSTYYTRFVVVSIWEIFDLINSKCYHALFSTKTLLNSHLSPGLYQHGIYSLSDDLVNSDFINSFKSKLEDYLQTVTKYIAYR